MSGEELTLATSVLGENIAVMLAVDLSHKQIGRECVAMNGVTMLTGTITMISLREKRVTVWVKREDMEGDITLDADARVWVKL